MEILKKVNDICPSCMNKHAVQIIRVHDRLTFKNVLVEFDAEYCYCENTDITYATGQQLDRNDITMKDAYRKKMGLLTSDQIAKIRQKCGLSQSELSRVLGWPEDTVKRYESHEVQSNEHDKILRKIDLQKTNSVI